MDNSMEFNLELALKGYPIRTRFGHPGEFHFINFGSFEFTNDLTEFIKNGLEETIPTNELNELNESNK